MATHSSILAWRMPWTEEPGGGYSPKGCKESRPITRCKSQWVPKGKVCSVTYGEMCYTPKQQPEFSHLQEHRYGEHMWGWVLSVWQDDGGKIKLDQVELIDMGSGSGDSAVNAVAQRVRKDSVCLFG